MQSDAATVEGYLAELPEDRREVVAAVRSTVLDHLPDGYDETMAHGMIAWVVPLERHPDTYNGEPLMYAALASQKRHLAVYLMGLYLDDGESERFERRYRDTGKRLDKGASCVRFRSLDDLPLDLVGEAIASMTPDEFVARAERARAEAAERRRR